MDDQSGPTSDERTMAAVGHGLTFVEGGILGPLIVYLVKKDDSPFVAFHALQSLYFGLGFLVVTMVCVAVIFLTFGLGIFLALPALLVFSAIYVVFEIVATIKAYNGEWYELPIAGPLARTSHPPQ
jgi:uncharacterized membrane protein